MRPVLVVSPHLDDAVLSCGQFLAGRPDCVVVTLFARVPDAGVITLYDEKCGFTSSKDAVVTRRQEDEEACAILRAKAVHLDFWDQQYDDGSQTAMSVALALRDVIDEVDPEFVVGPMGLTHPDHIRARDTALHAVINTHTTTPVLPIWLYEELPYRVVYPEQVQNVLAGWGKTYSGDLHASFIGTGPLERKLAALWSYRSQMDLPEFDNIHNFCVSERFWKVTK
jgi:LmbE family N-acetylglucosaminyl deacetylase